MKRIAIIDVETDRVLSVVGGSSKSLSATSLNLPEGRSFAWVPRGLNPLGCLYRDGVFALAPDCPERAMKKLRIARNEKLVRDVDLPPMRLASLSEGQRAELARYRQALLDLTHGDPFDPEWPARPDFI